MTQVANLTAGMAVPAKGDASFLKHDQSQLSLEEFADIMNRNTRGFLNTETGFESRSNETSDDKVSMGDTSDALKKDYEKFGSSNNRKIAQAQTDNTDSEAVSQKVQELAGKVKEAVQENMQVSEADVEQAMEVLGLGTLDLLQPQNLIELVQELTGSVDASALLTNENFQITMQEVTGLITDFQQENGLNATQFSDLLEQLSAQIDELEETVKKLLNVEEPTQSVAMTDMQSDGLQEEAVIGQEVPAEDVQTTQKAVSVAEQENPMASSTQEEPKNATEQVSEQSLAMAEEDQTEAARMTGQEKNPTPQDEKNKQQSFTEAADHEPAAAEHHTNLFYENTVTANTQTTAAVPEAPQVQSYIELEHLMDQLEGLARTFASAAGTTVEMQLNPENLGRLVLSVTEKHGNVTAQITASNEQVKETLQSQMVELHSTLQAQGIKVEAVEVTVATHEFEQNLDGNTSANGQMQEQANRQAAEQQNGRRNININSLDELSGLMSEEETLVAQMMRDNGGTVDFTA